MGGTAHASSKVSLTIYFYNPEINITRNAILKSAFDLYLKTQGTYRFQPVDNKETFEALIESEDSAVFMMSNWHYLKLIKTQLNQTSVLGLRGTKNGSDIYHKILVGTELNLNISTMSLASSGSEEYSRSILKDIYSLPHNEPSELNILTVPKDIDALMAVGFGLADAALTTKSSLAKLSTLYKNQYQQLHILGESQPLKRLAVVFKQVAPQEYQKIRSILKQMTQNKKGRRGLNMLGLDDWQLVNEQLTLDRKPKQ